MSFNAQGQTFEDILAQHYGYQPDSITKAAGGISSSTPGVYNPIYGAMVWANFNLEANIFGCLPKFVWDRSGWRIFTEKANSIADKDAGATTNNDTLGGTLEGGKVADPIHAEPETISVRPKTVQYPFEVTEVQEHLNTNSADDNWGKLSQQRVYASAQFKEMVNRQLSLNVGAIDTTAKDNKTRLNLEGIDRVVSSKAEFDSDTNKAAVPELRNPWVNIDATGSVIATSKAQIDRTTKKYDSVVTSAGSSMTTNGILTNRLITSHLADMRIAGGKDPTMIIAGQNTYKEAQNVYMGSVRIQNTADIRSTFQIDLNGIKTFAGTGVGLHISEIYGIPLIPSKDAPTDGTGTVGRLYTLDTSDPEGSGQPRLGIKVLKPFVYYEVSPRIAGYPFTTGGFVNKGVFQGIMELTCHTFVSQGKITNITSSV